MEGHVKENPRAALDALTTDSKLTLGKVALLCRMDAPILAGKFDDLNDTLAAIYVIETPVHESVADFQRIRDLAVVKYDSISPADYREKLAHALDEVAAFFEMMPRPAPDAKKNSGTDGVLSLPNGSAGHTDTGSTTSSPNSQPSRRRSSGAAGNRGRAAARPELS